MKKLIKAYSVTFIFILIVQVLFCVLNVFGILSMRLVFLSGPGYQDPAPADEPATTKVGSKIFPIEKDGQRFQATILMNTDDVDLLMKRDPGVQEEQVVPLMNVFDLINLYVKQQSVVTVKTVLRYAGYLGVLAVLANILLNMGMFFKKKILLSWLIIIALAIGAYIFLARFGILSVYHVVGSSAETETSKQQAVAMLGTWDKAFPHGRVVSRTPASTPSTVSIGPYLVDKHAQIMRNELMTMGAGWEIAEIVDPRTLVAYYVVPAVSLYGPYALAGLFLLVIVIQIFIGVSGSKYSKMKEKAHNSWLVLK